MKYEKVNTFSIYLSIYLSILIMSMLISGCPANNMCKECDEKYPLVSQVFCGLNCEDEPGIITVDPQKDIYIKGEDVFWGYENTNSEYEFLNWIAYPHDIRVSNIPLNVAKVRMKEELQLITARVGKKKALLTVRCDYWSFLMTGNRLNVPSNAINIQYVLVNGENVLWSYQVEYDKGSYANVSVTPAPGYIIDWYGSSVCSGRRYNENPTLVFMVDDVYLSPVQYPSGEYNSEFHEIYLDVENGNGIFLSSGCSNLCSYTNPSAPCDLGFFPYQYALSYGKFTFGFAPQDGKALALWWCTSDNLFATSEIVHANFTYVQNREHEAIVLLLDKVYLNINDPEGREYYDHSSFSTCSEGGVVQIIEPVSSFLYPPTAFDPYPLGWNPVPYSPLNCRELSPIETFSPCPECNKVKLQPIPCNGSAFLHWEISIDGSNWKKVYDTILTLYMNSLGPYDPENQPNDIHIPPGYTNLQVKPVFKLCCAFDCPECSGGPDGRDVIIDMYNNPDVKHGNSMYAGPAPDCCEYVTNQQNHPAHYESEHLLPFNKLQCNHGNLPYNHDGWAIEDGIAGCYHAVEQAYPGTVNITCVYRCPVKNSSLPNSSQTSKHMLGKAFDFDQLSSEANWDVANTAYTLNPAWEILLYENGERKKFTPTMPRTPPAGIEYTHGHIAI